MIEYVLTSFYDQLKKTRVEIIIDCSEEISIVSIPGIMEQVLINLIQNSLLYGFDDGTREGKIYITCELKKKRFHLEYRDDGKGMYICYNLVHRHHGTIYCESEPGKGVWFCLDLPTEKPDALS